MRILIWSDAGSHTGYGVVTENLATRWARRGAEIHVLACNYLGDPWPGPMRLYPATKYNQQDRFGAGRLKELIQKVKPDVLFITQDLYVVQSGLQALGGKFPIPTVLYVPIDGIHLPKAWKDAAKAANAVVAMSHHGKERLKLEADMDVEVLWHGVEHEFFYPISEKRPIIMNQNGTKRPLNTKEDCKQALGLGGRFVILAINRNSIRKNYYDTVRVFDRFRQQHPDAFLFIHAVQRDEGGDLAVLMERYGLTAEHVRIHSVGDTYLGAEKPLLSLIYNAADVKFSMSMAEGFGLTDAEAVATGVPVVAQDFSATSEVVGPGGILVPVARYFTTARMVDFGLPDLDKAYEALERLYNDEALRDELSAKAIEHAKGFNWDRTAFRMYEVLEQAVGQTAMSAVAAGQG